MPTLMADAFETSTGQTIMLARMHAEAKVGALHFTSHEKMAIRARVGKVPLVALFAGLRAS